MSATITGANDAAKKLLHSGRSADAVVEVQFVIAGKRFAGAVEISGPESVNSFCDAQYLLTCALNELLETSLYELAVLSPDEVN